MSADNISTAKQKPSKQICTLCGISVVSESDLFPCPSCGELFCAKDMLVVKEGKNDALCYFCAGDVI